MSLSSAIAIAQSAFSTTAQQTATVSKNIANSGNADYSRRMAMLGTTPGGAQIVSIYRAQNEALLKQNLIGISQSSAQSSLLSGLEIMKSALGGNDYESSPSTYLSAFRNSLQTFASTPGNATIAATVVSDASDLANSISKTSAAVQDLRLDSDKKIAEEVANLNRLLAQFETANNAVKQATAAGTDATAALDDRDKILKQVSELVGISTVTRANNDTVIYTSGGTVLFETLPREVTFAPKSAYDATVTGNGIFIDGVPLAAGSGADTSAQGKLAGLLQLRDDIAPTFQSQLDEMARGLVTLFKEGGLPDSSPGRAEPYRPPAPSSRGSPRAFRSIPRRRPIPSSCATAASTASFRTRTAMPVIRSCSTVSSPRWTATWRSTARPGSTPRARSWNSPRLPSAGSSRYAAAPPRPMTTRRRCWPARRRRSAA